jgi:hypothetical protein
MMLQLAFAKNGVSPVLVSGICTFGINALVYNENLEEKDGHSALVH